MKDPIVQEVVKKHEEAIKKAGHDLSDKPLAEIIPKKSMDTLKSKPKPVKELQKAEETFKVNQTIPEKRALK